MPSDATAYMPCKGWPDQPCAWDQCLAANACQKPHGPTGKDYAVDPTGTVAIEVEGATILSVEVTARMTPATEGPAEVPTTRALVPARGALASAGSVAGQRGCDDWTPEAMAAEAKRRKAMRNQGLCPDSGKAVHSCHRTICDCFDGDDCRHCFPRTRSSSSAKAPVGSEE